MNIASDSLLWRFWGDQFSVEVIEEMDRYTFPKVRTTTSLVRIELTPRKRAAAKGVYETKVPTRPPQNDWPCICVDVVRGRVPVHKILGLSTTEGNPFVHSTNLRDGRVESPCEVASGVLSSTGPFVLLPRVGRPAASKVAIAEVGKLVLSDCVFGLRPRDPNSLRSLQQLVLENFSTLAHEFVGSCAPYLTVERLLGWLSALGLAPTHVPASSNMRSDCGCDRARFRALA
jgi:hypothetical protein